MSADGVPVVETVTTDYCIGHRRTDKVSPLFCKVLINHASVFIRGISNTVMIVWFKNSLESVFLMEQTSS